MIGGNLTIGDELSADRKKDINKAEIGPERLKAYVKILKTNGFLSRLKGNKLVISQAEINQYLKNHLNLIDRLTDAEIELQLDRIHFKLNVKLLKSSTPTVVSTAAKLTGCTFDLNRRVIDFEIVEPQDVISNEVVAFLIAGIIVRIIQALMDTKIELGKVLENREFVDILCNRIGFDLNKSPYLANIFGSKIEGITVFDFVKINRIEVLPGELVVYPDLTMIS
ncbi:MAG: hypothetical protein ACOX5W_08755 [Bacillota bacterium]|jgi:hypothetical protein